VRVLLVEDHKPLARALKRGLEEEGFAVDAAEDGAEADFKARGASYDVIILDLMLPKIDGLTLLKQWRKDGIATHILLLTAKDTTEDKVKGLDLGADDYLTKPFQLEELLARLRALVRRRHQVKDPILRVHDLEIDTSARTVKRAGQVIHLTPREFALLQFLAFHRGKVVTRTMIWEHLYDEYDENTSNVVDVYIRYLRTKIDNAFEKKLILTRWGEGYMLRGEEE
jgi:DNA-binding response OmpR family regulator